MKTIKGKLFVSFGIILALMLISGVVSLVTIGIMDETGHELEDNLNADMMLDESVSDHLEWMISLSDYVYRGSSFEGELDPRLCVLGKWYKSFNSEHSDIMSIHARLEEPHKKLHNAALRIKELSGRGDKKGAIVVFEKEAEPFMEELMSIVARIKARTMKEVEDVSASREKAHATLKVVLMVTVAISILLGIVVVLYLNKSITKSGQGE
ncbi:MAG: CZB domain-containing protein [bacterium]